MSVHDMIAEGNKVACRWSMRGTHKGALFGFPPTRRQVEILRFASYRIAGGKVIGEGGLGGLIKIARERTA